MKGHQQSITDVPVCLEGIVLVVGERSNRLWSRCEDANTSERVLCNATRCAVSLKSKIANCGLQIRSLDSFAVSSYHNFLQSASTGGPSLAAPSSLPKCPSAQVLPNPEVPGATVLIT